MRRHASYFSVLVPPSPSVPQGERLSAQISPSASSRSSSAVPATLPYSWRSNGFDSQSGQSRRRVGAPGHAAGHPRLAARSVAPNSFRRTGGKPYFTVPSRHLPASPPGVRLASSGVEPSLSATVIGTSPRRLMSTGPWNTAGSTPEKPSFALRPSIGAPSMGPLARCHRPFLPSAGES